MEIFCRLGEYFVDDGNILQIMGIICRLWKYFADYGNTLQILGHRGGATLLGFDAMWMSCSALVLFIIIIIVILISIIVLIIVIYIALCVPHKQTSQCKDAWIRGLPATNSIPVKKRKSLKSHKLSQSTNNPRSSPAYAVYFLTWVWGTLTGFLPFLVREAVKQS